MKGCIVSVKQSYERLTPVEKSVADFVLKNADKVVYMPIDELAALSKNAKSAVIRFCKSVGFSGYSEFKIALAGDISKNKQLNYAPYIYPEDKTGDILDKVFSADIKTLHDTADRIDRKTLSEAVEMLAAAKKIYIYAIGTSAVIANDFQYRLMQQGFTVFCITDLPTMKVSTLNIEKGDAAIGISNSGRTIATIEALELAKAQGAKTVCITSYPDSELMHISDYPISVYSDEVEYPIEAISARIAHIGVIDAITIALSAKNYDNASERAKRTHELVDTIRK